MLGDLRSEVVVHFVREGEAAVAVLRILSLHELGELLLEWIFLFPRAVLGWYL